MPEEITPAVYQDAVWGVLSTNTRIKSRVRLFTSKVKEISDDLTAIDDYAKDMATLPISETNLAELQALKRNLTAFVSRTRDEVARLEAISDSLETLIP